MSVIYGGDSITFGDGSTVASGWAGFKNRIINGAMMIDQRNAGASVSVTGGDCSVDRFSMYYSGNSYTSQQSTVAPEGFKNSLLLTVTGTTTPTYSFFGQRIEGLNVADLGFGQSWAKTITVSFWVRSSVTGIYSIAITNGAGDRAYAVQYTINSANTWEYKTATILGDTTGTWLTNNANGIYWRFNMGSPSGRTITAGSWQAANADGANGSTGSISWATTSGATFYITGVQLEKGSTATSFDYRPYGTEDMLCKRYYQLVDGMTGSTNNGTEIHGCFSFPVEMRAIPTLSQTSVMTFTKVQVADYTQSSVSIFIPAAGRTGKRGSSFYVGNFSSVSTNSPLFHVVNNTGASGSIILSAEL